MNKLILSALLGVVLGFVASKVTFLQYLTLIPWGLAGLAVGWFSNTKSESIKNGAVYGFFLGLVFMFGVYQGKDPVISKVPFFVILGIFCAVFGVTLSLAAYFFKSKKHEKVSNS